MQICKKLKPTATILNILKFFNNIPLHFYSSLGELKQFRNDYWSVGPNSTPCGFSAKFPKVKVILP